MLLTTAADLTLPSLALHADKIIEVAPPQVSVHNSNVHQLSEPQQQRFASSEEMTALREEVKNLTTLVASSLARHSEPSRNSSRDLLDLLADHHNRDVFPLRGASLQTFNLAGTIANLVPEQNAARSLVDGRETKLGNTGGDECSSKTF